MRMFTKKLQAVIVVVSVVVTAAIAYWHLTRRSVLELQVQGSGVTLYVRVAGNAGSGNVLIAIHGGPGMSSDYMASLEQQLAGDELAVVTYDQRGTASRSSTYLSTV